MANHCGDGHDRLVVARTFRKGSTSVTSREVAWQGWVWCRSENGMVVTAEVVRLDGYGNGHRVTAWYSFVGDSRKPGGRNQTAWRIGPMTWLDFKKSGYGGKRARPRRSSVASCDSRNSDDHAWRSSPSQIGGRCTGVPARNRLEGGERFRRAGTPRGSAGPRRCCRPS